MLNKWTIAPFVCRFKDIHQRSSLIFFFFLRFLLEHVLFFLLFELRVSKKGTDLLAQRLTGLTSQLFPGCWTGLLGGLCLSSELVAEVRLFFVLDRNSTVAASAPVAERSV